MPSFVLRLLPALAFLGFLASPFLPDLREWSSRGDLMTAVGANGMTIDPDGGGAPGGSPVVIADPADPGQ
ncbi:MAG TPA: hypothetical protein VEW48_09050 [Thermoanaerobaculia bacterium]|nr:hypothetical protein [Thermoanaerobaculia bacterium]